MSTLVPAADGATVYLVLEDFDTLGQAWRETDIRNANESAVIQGILSGEYEHPLRVVAFNVEQGWALDVTADIDSKALDAAQAQDVDRFGARFYRSGRARCARERVSRSSQRPVAIRPTTHGQN